MKTFQEFINEDVMRDMAKDLDVDAFESVIKKQIEFVKDYKKYGNHNKDRGVTQSLNKIERLLNQLYTEAENLNEVVFNLEDD